MEDDEDITFPRIRWFGPREIFVMPKSNHRVVPSAKPLCATIKIEGSLCRVYIGDRLAAMFDISEFLAGNNHE